MKKPKPKKRAPNIPDKSVKTKRLFVPKAWKEAK